MNLNDEKYWNKEIISYPTFLQSWQWGEVQKKLGRRIFRLNAKNFSALIIEQDLPFGQKYFYIPHGPIIDRTTDDIWPNFKNEIEKIASKKDIFVRIEPINQESGRESIESILLKNGFRQTKPVQPKTTLVIDLNKDEKEIMDAMEHNTRYSIRTAEKRGVTTEFLEGKNKENYFEIFWEIFSETNRRHGLKTYSKDYYKEVAGLEGECYSKIAIAKLEDRPISAAIFVYFGNRVFYLFAGSKAGYGKFNAPTYLIWQAIINAKKSGYRYFDFWGISRENKNWSKITAFKKSFGGEEITSAGAWDYVFSKPRYFVYNLIKLIKS